jgi:CDP-diglyceride synthetase
MVLFSAERLPSNQTLNAGLLTVPRSNINAACSITSDIYILRSKTLFAIVQGATQEFALISLLLACWGFREMAEMSSEFSLHLLALRLRFMTFSSTLAKLNNKAMKRMSNAFPGGKIVKKKKRN